MIELLPETKGTTVAIKATGVLTVIDEESITPALENMFEALPEMKRMRVFIDYAGLEGFAPGVKSAGLSFELRHRGLVERIAFICDADLQDEVDRMADIFKMAHVKRFDPASRNDAWNWLNSE